MPRAERDLIVIYQRIGAQDSKTALTWHNGLRAAIRTLRENPYRCPATPESEDFRHLLYGNPPHTYRVIYRVLETQREVRVLHVRHGARQEFRTADLN
jgi:plasmid stabilization system protein ParE